MVYGQCSVVGDEHDDGNFDDDDAQSNFSSSTASKVFESDPSSL